MRPVVVRRIMSAFRRRAVRWTAAVVVLVLLVGASLVVAYRTGLFGRERGISPGVSALVRPDTPTTLELPGLRLEIPAGAVVKATRAHLTAGGADPLATLTAGAAGLLEPVGRPIEVDLSGQQPRVPLILVLDVPPPVDPAHLVLLTRHGSEPGSLVGTYDPGGRRCTALLAQLSGFRVVAVRPVQVFEAARDLVAGLLGGAGIAGTKPG